MPKSEPRSRAWWLIPVGCLGAFVFCCGLPVSIGLVLFGAIKSSTPYQESLARAQANPEVQELLGEPIEAAFLVSGSIEVNGPNGHAGLSYDVSGPKGTATVTLDADKVGGEWTYNILKVQPTTGRETINLLGEQVSDAPALPAPDAAPAEDVPADE